jgi:hypothetical protein
MKIVKVNIPEPVEPTVTVELTEKEVYLIWRLASANETGGSMKENKRGFHFINNGEQMGGVVISEPFWKLYNEIKTGKYED